MTLIVRYLSAVRDHLPRGEQDDIINELSDNLRSRFEDEEAARGRPLLEEEEVAILKEFGHPMAVAARYRGDERTVTFGRRLIGPELFSIYMKVLAINVAVTVLIGLIALVAGATLWSGFAGILVPLAIQFMIVTAIFVWIDRRWVRDPDGWDPRTVNVDGPGHRRLDPRWPCGPVARQGVHALGIRGDVGPGDRRARHRVDRGAEHRFAGPDRVHGARAGLERRLLAAIAVIVSRS